MEWTTWYAGCFCLDDFENRLERSNNHVPRWETNGTFFSLIRLHSALEKSKRTVGSPARTTKARASERPSAGQSSGMSERGEEDINIGLCGCKPGWRPFVLYAVQEITAIYRNPYHQGTLLLPLWRWQEGKAYGEAGSGAKGSTQWKCGLQSGLWGDSASAAAHLHHQSDLKRCWSKDGAVSGRPVSFLEKDLNVSRFSDKIICV